MTLQEEFENNFTILSESHEFKVDKFQIASRMIRFKRDPTFFLTGFYKISTKCDKTIIEKFIEAGKTGKCPEFNLETVPFYQQLSLEFEFNSLFKACNAFILGQKDLLNIVKNHLSESCKKSNKEIILNSIETALAFNLTIEHLELLKSLPICVLYRVLSNPQRPASSIEKLIYDFIKTRVEKGTKESKMLLSTIKYESFSHEELSHLFSKTNAKSNKPSQNTKQEANEQESTGNAKTGQKTDTKNAKPNKSSQNSKQETNDKETTTSAKTSTKTESKNAKPASSSPDLMIYIPESSTLKQTEKKILEIVNCRRSKERPLTADSSVSNAIRGYFGSKEEIKEPTEIDFMILEDRFSSEVTRRHIFIHMNQSEEETLNYYRSEVAKLPTEDIANSNFLAICVLTTNNLFYTAMIIGNSPDGKDQTDPNPPKVAQQSASTSQLPVDLSKSLKTEFYNGSANYHDWFFSSEISEKLNAYLDDADAKNARIAPQEVMSSVPEVKRLNVLVKVNGNMKSILDFVKGLNKSGDGCLIGLAHKQLKNKNLTAVVLAFAEQKFTDDQIKLMELIKSINKLRVSFNYLQYLDLCSFEPKGKIDDFGDSLGNIIVKEDPYKYIYINSPNYNGIETEINAKFRTKIALSVEIAAIVKKFDEKSLYAIIIYKQNPK